MVGVLFWNTGIRKSDVWENPDKVSRIEDAVADAASENNCDIIILAEFPISTTGLCNQLSLTGRDFRERYPIVPKARVKILADSFLKNEIIRDSRYYAVHDFRIADYHFLLAGVHLPSKLHANERDIQITGRQLIEAVREAEAEVKHQKVVITGDFNANPFEDVIAGSDYLHAIFDSAIVERIRSRIVYGARKQIFYNPMWNLFGDYHDPKGSYYSESGESYRLYWNIFDQVIMSADFIRAYRKESLKIITGTSGRQFADRSGKPDASAYSDHFPLFFSFQEDLL